MKDLKSQIQVAKDNRDAENAEYQGAKSDDLSAKGLVEKTITVLKKFYEDEGLVLAQTRAFRSHQAPEMSPAGEAPPPPPPTWSDGGYKGSQGESNGIQAILQMIVDDIVKDMRVAQEEEDKSEQTFQDYKSETQAVI